MSARRLPMRLLVVALIVVVAAYVAQASNAHTHRAASTAASGRTVLAHAATSTDSSAAAVAPTTVRLAGGRSYLLIRPSTTTESTAAGLPLVVLLHGTDISAATEMTFTGFAALARSQDFLLVAPESVGPTWNSGDDCCGAPARDHLDDTAFVSSVIADVRRHEDVDPSRIYLVGYSAGGKLSYDVACALPGTFAATATYGAGPQLTCAHPVARPAFVGYGTADTLEPIAGKPHNDRGEHQPAALTVAQLRTLDGCAGAGTETSVGPATIDAWTACSGGTAVEYVRWAGQTHTFPTTPAVAAGATASTLMWRFFQQHVHASAGATTTVGTARA